MRQSSVNAQLRGRKKRRRRNVKRSQACHGKKRYRDHGEAVSALHAAHDGPTGTVPVRCYFCTVCSGYHLTSQPKRSG